MHAVMQGDATEAQIGAIPDGAANEGRDRRGDRGIRARDARLRGPGARARARRSTRAARAVTERARSTSRRSRAIVVAGAGVPVAKHGNRAASSSCGSADLLEELGVKIDLDARRRGAVPRGRPGSDSCSRRSFHPAIGARRRRCGRELRVPTAFNFLGPLTNPARPYAQVVGVSDERMLPLMAEVLARRGTRAKLFRGVDGLDELTTTDLSAVYDVKDGTVRETHLDPGKLGLGEGQARGSRGRRRTAQRVDRPSRARGRAGAPA